MRTCILWYMKQTHMSNTRYFGLQRLVHRNSPRLGHAQITATMQCLGLRVLVPLGPSRMLGSVPPAAGQPPTSEQPQHTPPARQPSAAGLHGPKT